MEETLKILVTFREDQMDAIKKKQTNRKVVINLMLARLTAANKDMMLKHKRELTDSEVIDQIKTELKQTRDSLIEAEKANRQDQITENTEKIEVILTYLPTQMDESAITEVIKETAVELGLDLITKNKGQIIKAVMAKCGKNVEGKAVSTILATLLV